MSGDISLFDLVNVSIGTPEPGAVNFSALHTLLHAILEHLQIQNVNAVWSEADAGHGPGELLLAAACPQNPYRRMEDKLRHMERQLAALEHLPSGSELLSRSASVNDVWQLLQLRRRVEGSEDGVTKCVSLIQDLLMEIRELKESRDSLKKEVENLQIQCNQINVDQLVDRVTAVEHCLHHVEDLKSATKVLKDKVALYPEPEDLTQCVTWEVMQAALFSGRQKTKKDPKDSATGTGLPRMALNVGNCVSPAAGLPGMAESRSSDGPVLVSSQIPPSQQGLLKESEGVLPLLVSQPLSRISSGAQRYPETVEALRDVGRLQEKHKNLESRVECLEGCKADRDQVQQLRELLSDSAERDIPENIREQVNHLNGLMETVLTDRDKVTEMKSLIMGTASVSESSDLGEEGIETESANSQGKDSTRALQQQPQHLHIVNLRKAVQKLDEEGQQLKQDVASVRLTQKSSTDKQIQLDHLQSVPEEIRAPSSAVLLSNIQQRSAELDQSDEGQVAGQGQGQDWGQPRDQGGLSGQGGQTLPAHHSFLVDMSTKVSQLFQRYETLHNMVSSLINQQASSRMAQDTDFTSELVGDVQGAILQLQAECEKLHITANQLIEDHSQKQNHIDYLYKAIEELDEKKADREVVEMEIGIKADKRALESKVSRTQFDTMTEQLNGMFQELLSKITGQEQDWNKVINKISTEMESKLNRIELDPLKKQLEDRWKSIRKQLQIQPAPEHDDAAGFRKQLVARFHCISCDRPVDMTTPGSHLMTVPSAPGLPSHKSNRPYTIYELEQVRQHSKSEHIPEMATYSYLAMSRSCGGSHTLTYTNRRYSRLQHITQLIQTEDDGLAMSSSGLRVQPEEVDILGLDGHIYKGRLNTRAVKTLESRLPTISSKEGICKSKNWGRHCQSQKCSGAEPGRRSPLRPQSGSRSGGSQRHVGTGSHNSVASSSSVKDRLVPSMDCLFQPCAPQSSAEPDNELLQDRELHRDFSQSQNAPVTSL